MIDVAGKQWVLRKKPECELLPSAHPLDREYRVMKALAATAVPVPRMLCADPVGTAFDAMAFVRGRILSDSAPPQFDAAERAAL